jgi:hypothetical protein
MAALLQDADEMAADEATGAGDDHEIILGHVETLCSAGPSTSPARHRTVKYVHGRVLSLR